MSVVSKVASSVAMKAFYLVAKLVDCWAAQKVERTVESKAENWDVVSADLKAGLVY